MSNYRILLRGVQPGQSVEEVAQALSRYSKKPPEVLRSLLRSGKRSVAKRTREAQQATRYKLFLEKLGCDCVIEAELTPNETSNATSVLVTEFTDQYAREATPGRSFTYRQTGRFRELIRAVSAKTLLGLVVFGAALYYGWQHLQ